MPHEPLDYATPTPARPRGWSVTCGVFEGVAVLLIAVSGTRFVHWGFKTLASIDLTYGSRGEVDRCFDACVATVVPLAHGCGLFLLCRWLRRRPPGA